MRFSHTLLIAVATGAVAAIPDQRECAKVVCGSVDSLKRDFDDNVVQRDEEPTTTSMTTTMVMTLTVNSQPTAQEIAMQAVDASAKKPAPAAKNGAPVGNGSPVIPPKNGAVHRGDGCQGLVSLGLVALVALIR